MIRCCPHAEGHSYFGLYILDCAGNQINVVAAVSCVVTITMSPGEVPGGFAIRRDSGAIIPSFGAVENHVPGRSLSAYVVVEKLSKALREVVSAC